jgi:hypothetical protein
MPFGIALIAAALATTAAPDPKQSFGNAMGAALQADEVKALAALDGVDLSSLPERDRAAATCMRERFGPNSRPAPAASASLTDRALAIYRDYWHTAITHPERRAAEEQRLETRVRTLLKAPKQADLDALEPLLSEALKKEGVHSLQGRTGLLRELMIWGKQDEKVVPVDLPDGQYRAKVEYLNGFKSFGWSEYATCGRAATGGWATEEALFAVVPRYESLDGEEFKVSFLGHETQHFSDKARFKDLKPWELEYRAKLVELAFADTTRTKVLKRFIVDQGIDPESPHSYADRAVLSDLVKRLQLKSADDLFTVDLARLHEAARATLLEDSRKRAAAQAVPIPTN